MRPGPVVALLLLAILAPGAARAQGPGTPAELEGIDIEDRSGDLVPLDLVLLDERGEKVVLGSLLRDRPAVIQLVYYECPMLCTLVLNAYLEAAREIDWTPGGEYTVITVSFDPRDTPKLAAAKKESHVKALERPEAAGGWHFLVGEEPAVRALAEAVGFSYRFDEESGEFAHPAAMFVVSPGGRISRTLYGIEFSPQDLRLSLVEAGEGRLGSPFDKLLLYCFRYDPETHKYALVAANVMKVGGGLTAVALGIFLTVLWMRERAHRPRLAA